MSFLGNLFGRFISPKNFNQDEIPAQIHRSIDWSNSVVAGSYALKQFTGDTHWDSHDVDIMVACDTKEDFQASADQFVQNSGATLQKEAWFGEHAGKRGSTDDELFHNRVLGSKTYIFPNYSKTIQLICLQRNFPLESPVSILNETTDIPACVSYSMNNDDKIFHIPEKGRQILMTRHGSYLDICRSRRAKYEERGYTFN